MKAKGIWIRSTLSDDIWKGRHVEPVWRCQRLKFRISFRLWLPRTIWYPTLPRLWSARGFWFPPIISCKDRFLTLLYLWCQTVFLPLLWRSSPDPLVVVNYASGDFNLKWSFLGTCFAWKRIHCHRRVCWDMVLNCQRLLLCSKTDPWKKSFLYPEEQG